MDEATKRRIARGKAVVDEWERTRQPFLLYFRTFHITMYHGPEQRMLLENHFWATLLLYGVNVLTVADPNEDPLPGAYGHGAPALLVAPAEWQDTVAALIPKASVVVSEIPILTPGAEFELRTCQDAGQLLKTIPIIPSPDGPFPPLDDDPRIKDLPRSVHYDELPELDACDHFVWRDLIERAREIAALDPNERVALANAGELERRFPITFAGLREGYEETGAQFEAAGAYRRAGRSYFRAIVVATMLRQVERAALNCESIARVAIRVNDKSAAVNYLRGGVRLADQAGEEELRCRMEETLRSIEAS